MKLLFLGPPGAGKGTQAERIEKAFAIKKLSTGDMLREAVAQDTDLGRKASVIMNEGGLVPDDIMIGMIRERIIQDDCKNGFILDGFPRTVAQAEALEEMLNDLNTRIDAVLELAVDDVLLSERIAARFSCKQCGASYNKITKRPIKEGVCDNCGSTEFLHRSDDTVETVTSRLASYHSKTAPLLPFYRGRDLLHSVNGMEDIDKVTDSINEVLNSVVK